LKGMQMSLTYRYISSIFPNSGFENPAEFILSLFGQEAKVMLVLRMQEEDVRDMLNTGSCGWLPRQRGFL
jgi:hypothetical protein